MKTYRGRVTARGHEVSVENDHGGLRPLDPRHDLANHSPDGLAWGYHGSGPAQLSLAILADCLTDTALALELYQDFKRSVIAQLGGDHGWTLQEATVRLELDKIIAARKEARVGSKGAAA